MNPSRVTRHVSAAAVVLAASLASTSARQDRSDVDLFVPSTAAGTEGVAVRVAFPTTPRYADGAPIAIFVAGGGDPDAYVVREHASGVVEITFAFPGGELDGRKSGGTADARGPLALRALADVVEFALGRTRGADGRLLRDLAPYPLRQEDVGLVGWSRGGDAAVNALARYPDQTSGVAWVVTHESPAFDAAMTGTIVVRPGATAAAADYVPGTCALLACQVLYPSLRWEPNTAAGGSLHLDRNGNGALDRSSELALPFSIDPVSGKRIFVLSAVEAATADGVFGSAWPSSVATLDEARAFWAWRDVRWNIGALIERHRSLAAILHVTEQDHVQSAPDHPHVALVYNSLLLGGLRWVRMNPDAAYTAALGSNMPDNPANAALPSDFQSWRIPEGASRDSATANAAIHELCDRVHADRWDANLDEVLR